MARFEARFLQLLDEHTKDYAIDALRNPKGKESFDYGESVGYLRGLAKAKELFEDALRNEEEEARGSQGVKDRRSPYAL